MSETQGDCNDFVIADVVAMDLSAGAAADDMTFGIETAQLAIALAVHQLLTAAEIEHEMRRLAQGVRSAPAMGSIPVNILNLHPTLSAALEPQIVKRRIASPLIARVLRHRWLPRDERYRRGALDSP